MKSVFASLLLLAAPLAFAADHLVVLQKKEFNPPTLNIKVGDSVEFRNNDPFDHSVLSQSQAKTFDLETLSPGQSRKVVFDKPGTVEVECGAHSGMQLTLQVSQ